MCIRRVRHVAQVAHRPHSPPREIAVGLNGVNSHSTENALFSIAMNEAAGSSTLREIDSYNGEQLVEMDFVSRSIEHAGDRWAYELLPAGREKLAEMLGFHVPPKKIKVSTMSDLADLVDDAAARTEWRGVTIHPPEHLRKVMAAAELPISLGRTALRAVRDGSWPMAINHITHAADTEEHNTGSRTVWGPVLEAFKSMMPPE